MFGWLFGIDKILANQQKHTLMLESIIAAQQDRAAWEASIASLTKPTEAVADYLQSHQTTVPTSQVSRNEKG